MLMLVDCYLQVCSLLLLLLLLLFLLFQCFELLIMIADHGLFSSSMKKSSECIRFGKITVVLKLMMITMMQILSVFSYTSPVTF